MTRSTMSWRLRILPLHGLVAAVRSDASRSRSSRWTSRSTSLRSPFWLTERLGRTSQPTRSVGRGEIETVKHPSPSTYPEMYDGRSVRCCSESPRIAPSVDLPRPDRKNRVRQCPEPLPEGISRYGVIPRISRQRTSHGIARRLPAPVRVSPL